MWVVLFLLVGLVLLDLLDAGLKFMVTRAMR
jgi:hypothetical protein